MAGKALRLLSAAAAALALPAAACEAPQKVFADGAVIAEARPRLAWPAVAGATGYRFRLQSRVPEGKVIAASDTVLEAPAFVPPRPLAEQRAKVTLRVRAICGKEESAETVSWFLIDTSAGCRIGELKVSGKEIAWEAVPGAWSYEVRRYSLADARLLQSIETREARVAIEAKEGAVIGVRPACAGGLGEAVYRVIAR
jgi:hypothetical protein